MVGEISKVLSAMVLRLRYPEVFTISSNMIIKTFPRINKWFFREETVAPLPKPPTHVTKLKSGITVVTNDYFDVSNPTANPKVGLYLKRGFVHETKENKGVFRLLCSLLGNIDTSKSVSKKAHTFSFDKMQRETLLSEERIFFISTVDNTSEISSTIDFYHDMIKHPLFTKEALDLAKEKSFAEYKENFNKEKWIMNRLVLLAAYPDSPLHFSLEEGYAHHITPTTLYKTIEDHFVGENIVLVASGIEHFQFVNICNNVFFNFPSHSLNSPAIIPKYKPKSIQILEENEQFKNSIFICVGTELFPKTFQESIMAVILRQIIKKSNLLHSKTNQSSGRVALMDFNGTGLLAVMGKTTPEEANETALRFLSLFRFLNYTLSEKQFNKLKNDAIIDIYLQATQDYCSDDNEIINKLFYRKLIQLERDNFESKNYFQEEIDALDKITFNDFNDFMKSVFSKRDLCMGVAAHSARNLLVVRPIESLQAILDDIEKGIINTK